MKPYYETELGKLYHGDCREVMKGLEHVDLIIADPPYNIGKKYGEKTNDKKDPGTYWGWFTNIFSGTYQLLNDGYFYVFHSDKGVYKAKPILEMIGLEYIQTLIWWGKNGYSRSLHRNTWSFRHEPILFFRKGSPEKLEVNKKGMHFTTVIEVSRPQSNFKEGRFHQTQKPIKLYSILIYRTPGKITLDPFLGSGTTAIVCEKLSRRWIGIEIEEKNCEIAAKRIENERSQLKMF